MRLWWNESDFLFWIAIKVKSVLECFYFSIFLKESFSLPDQTHLAVRGVCSKNYTGFGAQLTFLKFLVSVILFCYFYLQFVIAAIIILIYYLL